MTNKNNDNDKLRYNVHFRMAGFMVLDYEATPEMGNIYGGPKDYQMVIADVSRKEARRVCDLLNQKEQQINEVEQDLQDFKDMLADWLFENIGLFNDEQINEINNLFCIDLMDMLELYIE